MPAKVISIPLIVCVVWNLYVSITEQVVHTLGIIVPVVLLAVIYVLSPQVDWFWYSRFPPDFPAALVGLLERSTGPYAQFSAEEKVEFRKKAGLFNLNLAFKGPTFDDKIPEDIQMVVAANALLLTRNQRDFLLPKFQVVVIYPGAFPSPQYPEHFHASELFEEDGVLLFSAQHLLSGFLDPGRYYNVGLHEWAHAFICSYPEYAWPAMDDSSWVRLEAVSGFSKEALQGYVNRPDIEVLPAAVVHYIHFPERFRGVFPELATYFNQVFGV